MEVENIAAPLKLPVPVQHSGIERHDRQTDVTLNT
jgi:hypothetical protein